MGDVKLPLTNFLGEVDMGGGAPIKKLRFFGPDQQLLSAPSDFKKKIIAYEFLKATYPQVPYWVHFIFEVQNPLKSPFCIDNALLVELTLIYYGPYKPSTICVKTPMDFYMYCIELICNIQALVEYVHALRV